MTFVQVGPATQEAHDDSSNEGFEPLANIFALGDCCANVENPLPSLAQA